ncbi:hypothetical protein D3C83_01220 [compost metagenome]
MQFLRASGHFRCRRLAHEGVEVDADRKISDAHRAPAGRDLHHLPAPLHGCALYQRAHALQEVPAVAQGLETNEVELQQRLDERHAPGQLEKDVRRRERDVQEEPRAGSRAEAAQFRSNVHQVIIMHPDEIPRRARFVHCPRELAIHLTVGAPVRGIKVAQQLHIVKQRPDDLVRKTLVEIAHLFRGERHALQCISRVLAESGERSAQIRRVVHRPRPADPHAAAMPQHRQQRRHQPASPRLGVPATGIGALEHERQAVRYHDQAVPSLYHASVSVTRALMPAAPRARAQDAQCASDRRTRPLRVRSARRWRG